MAEQGSVRGSHTDVSGAAHAWGPSDEQSEGPECDSNGQLVRPARNTTVGQIVHQVLASEKLDASVLIECQCGLINTKTRVSGSRGEVCQDGRPCHIGVGVGAGFENREIDIAAIAGGRAKVCDVNLHRDS